MKHLIRVAAVAVWTALAAPAVAQDFQAGLTAHEAGDFVTALENLWPVAEQGYVKAQFLLGMLYFAGDSVPQDYAEALRWYRLAAEQGDVPAQMFIAFMHTTGIGAPQDYAEARRWYRLAPQQGYADAQELLGNMYTNGNGVPQNDVSAHMWYNIASANGDESAAERRDDLAEQMTPDQIADAQARARVCMASGYQDCDWRCQSVWNGTHSNFNTTQCVARLLALSGRLMGEDELTIDD